jgi:hypothetical protein
MRFHAKNVSVGESGDEFFAVSFDSEAPSDDDSDLSGHENPYLIVQRQFEDDDGGVRYIETHDHDTYTGHFRLQLIEFTPTRLAFEIARKDHKYVEVTYDLDAKRFDEAQPSSPDDATERNLSFAFSWLRRILWQRRWSGQGGLCGLTRFQKECCPSMRGSSA